MPTSQRSSKGETSKRPSTFTLKRVIVTTLLVGSNVASYVVGNPNISASELIEVIGKTLLQCVTGN